MLHDLWTDLEAWWATVPPEFAFLLALPFGVALLGLAADRRQAHRRRVAAPRPAALGSGGPGGTAARP